MWYAAQSQIGHQIKCMIREQIMIESQVLDTEKYLFLKGKNKICIFPEWKNNYTKIFLFGFFHKSKISPNFKREEKQGPGPGAGLGPEGPD